MSRIVLAIGLLVPLVSAVYVLRLVLAPVTGGPVGGAAAATSPPPRVAQPTPAPPAAAPRPPPPGPPPPLAASAPTPTAPPAPPASPTPREAVVVANTGALGGVLRAEPVTGRQVAAMRDGQRLDVLERTTVDGGEWVHVRTADGVEGWIAARIVAPAPT
jgi:hypothetical protein